MTRANLLAAFILQIYRLDAKSPGSTRSTERYLATVTVLTLINIITGCAGTSVVARRTYAEGEHVAKPGRIIIYDIAATPGDLPADDPILDFYGKPSKTQTSDEVSLGRKLGNEIAGELEEGIKKLGMPCERAGADQLPPAIGDIVIRGAFMSIEEGSRLKRVLIGFGAGARELKTAVEIYEITPEGRKPLISEEIKATGGKMPGMLITVAAAVAIGPAGLAVSPGPATTVAGSISEATTVSGGMDTAKEIGPESLSAAAKRTAGEILKALTRIFRQHG